MARRNKEDMMEMRKWVKIYLKKTNNDFKKAYDLYIRDLESGFNLMEENIQGIKDFKKVSKEFETEFITEVERQKYINELKKINNSHVEKLTILLRKQTESRYKSILLDLIMNINNLDKINFTNLDLMLLKELDVLKVLVEKPKTTKEQVYKLLRIREEAISKGGRILYKKVKGLKRAYRFIPHPVQDELMDTILQLNRDEITPEEAYEMVIRGDVQELYQKYKE